jgi:tetratricopeptide (TPR) repeat protein
MLARTAIAFAFLVFKIIPVTIFTGQHTDDHENWTLCVDAADPEVRVGGCTALIQSGKESQEDLSKAYVNRGLGYADEGQVDRAIEDYDHAIRLDPNDTHALISRGLTYADKEQYDRAIGDCDHAIRLNPNDAQGFVCRGLVYARKKHDRTIEEYDDAIQLNPNDINIFVDRGGGVVQLVEK